MATKKVKPGRPKAKDPVKTKYVYLTDKDEKRILRKYEDITDAVRKVVLPLCG